MGGSLASEAIILLSRVTFQHNIIGIIGLDARFLGVHLHADGIPNLWATSYLISVAGKELISLWRLRPTYLFTINMFTFCRFSRPPPPPPHTPHLNLDKFSLTFTRKCRSRHLL